MKWCSILVAAWVSAAPAAGADARALAASIDRHIEAKLQANHVQPAPRSDDATFFRRAHLALAGRVPISSETRSFLAETDPAKRAKLIDKLLGSAAYANHMTNVWRNWLLPEALTSPEVAGTVPAFDIWLRSRIQAGQPYDRFVTELLTAALDGRAVAGRPAAVDDSDAANGPLAFYTAKEGKPENLAAATSRLFLGVRLECAQCHDHPFAKWSRDQFWGMAAFYGGISRTNGTLREVFDRRELVVPNRDRAVAATFLDGKEPEWRFKKSPRVTLTAWLTAPENPFFAKAAVNRLWSLVFGVGIVDPIDDFHERNPPSHPELLDELAHAFVDAGYDTKFILRALCLTETFNRASTIDQSGQADVRLFARFPMHGLSPEQLFDSLNVVVGEGAEPQGNGSMRSQFVDTFALSGEKTATQTTILQALTLMNGTGVGAATSVNSSKTLAAIVDLPGLSKAERIEALYLAALGRTPNRDEAARALRYVVARAVATEESRYGDILWALLNSVEFRTNH